MKRGGDLLVTTIKSWSYYTVPGGQTGEVVDGGWTMLLEEAMTREEDSAKWCSKRPLNHRKPEPHLGL